MRASMVQILFSVLPQRQYACVKAYRLSSYIVIISLLPPDGEIPFRKIIEKVEIFSSCHSLNIICTLRYRLAAEVEVKVKVTRPRIQYCLD